jgi:hypothetical protein
LNDLALEIALANLKGFVLKSGGDEDATTKPEARGITKDSSGSPTTAVETLPTTR